MDMNTAIAEYCRHLELAGRSRLTVSSYRQDLTKLWAWLEGAWGGKPALADVTPVDLAEYRLYLMRYCRPATVNKALVVLKAFFAWAEKKGMITGNPAANLKPVRRPGSRCLDRRDQLRLLRKWRSARPGGMQPSSPSCFTPGSACARSSTSGWEMWSSPSAGER